VKQLYLIHGEETLTKIEAADRIRALARQAGHSERSHHVADASFDWSALAQEGAAMSLFADRRLIEVTVVTAKVGAEAQSFIEAVAKQADESICYVFDLPRLDRAQTESAWFAHARRVGEVIAAPLVEREALPGWIADRLQRHGFTAGAEVIELLAERCEGNLLAARQEIEKLALLVPAGELDLQAVLTAVSDVARFDLDALSLAFLCGDLPRYDRLLTGLRAEGEMPPRLVWRLAEDVHAFAHLLLRRRDGVPFAQALRESRVWGRRQQAMEQALERIAPARVPGLLRRLARLDAQAKGQATGDPWIGLAGLAAYAHGVLELPLAVEER